MDTSSTLNRQDEHPACTIKADSTTEKIDLFPMKNKGQNAEMKQTQKDFVREKRKIENGSTPSETRQLKWQKKMRFQPQSVKFNKTIEQRDKYYKNLVDPASQSKIEIPRAISVADQVESSAKEMQAMLRAVSQHTNNKAVLQRLPRHMRRRAASHSTKRLPRRFRDYAEDLAQMGQGESGINKVKKPLNRKKRRRNRDLQNEYAKRAGKHGWLETHMWHSKRFHMTESNDPKYSSWGHRVALFPNDKSFRACYRAVSSHCLIQDVSYLRSSLLCGRKDNMIKVFKSICQDADLDPLVIEGQKEVELLLYKYENVEGSHRQCIGPILMLWKPQLSGENDDNFHEILIWSHPVSFASVIDSLSSATRALNADIRISDTSNDFNRFRLTGPKSSVTLLSILRPLNEYPTCGEADGRTKFRAWMVKNKLLASRLHDDFSLILEDCHKRTYAKQYTYSNVQDYADGAVFPVISDDPRLTLPLQKTAPLLSNTVCHHRHEKTKEGKEEVEHEILCDSPLWDKDIREEVFQSRVPDHIVSTRKREQKFNMDENQVEKWKNSLSTAVPVVVISKNPTENRRLNIIEENEMSAVVSKQSSQKEVENQTSKASDGFAAGWDLILPRGWATAFWVPLIYHRARAGGLREDTSTCLESWRPHFPEDFPDTEAGKRLWDAEADKLATKYYRKPPAKRVNYSVLGVPNPFQPNWNDLFLKSSDELEVTSSLQTKKEAHGLKRSAEVAENPVMSPKRLKLESESEEKQVSSNSLLKTEPQDQKCEGGEAGLKDPSDCSSVEPEEMMSDTGQISVNSSPNMGSMHVLRDLHQVIALKQWMHNTFRNSFSNEEKNFVFKMPETHQNLKQLVCVSIIALNKGKPFSRSMICMPSSADLDDLCSELCDPYKYGLQSVTGPTEPKHWDPYRKKRKEARKEAKKKKRRKKKGEESLIVSEDAGKDLQVDPADTQTHVKQPHTFPVPPSHEVMGYVTSGDFLFSHGYGAGVGFVSLEKWVSLVERQVCHDGMRKLCLDAKLRELLTGDAISIPLLALFRNTDSVQYRFVKLELIKPW